MSENLIRVIKLGGSLLELEDLAERFERWLSMQPPASNVLVGGGGPLVDVLRTLDSRLTLPEETAHWLCIRAMSITATLVAQRLQNSVLATSLRDLRSKTNLGKILVFDSEDFLKEEAKTSCTSTLPCSWDVTSDSIAAHVAARIEAGELVLLKSALPPEDCSLEQASQSHYVDAYFPTASAGLSKIRCVNFRDDDFCECDFS